MGHFFSTNKIRNYSLFVQTNKPIKNLPPKIKNIIFSCKTYDVPEIFLLDNIFVEIINFKERYYNKSLEFLPPKLKELYLSYGNYTKINNFPQNLEILDCCDEFYIRQTNIPNTLKKLYICQSSIILNENHNIQSIILPSDLEELYFRYEADYIPNDNFLQYLISLLNNLPPNLKILEVPNFWNLELLNLPTTLEKIYLGVKFNQNLDFLPESIKTITFDEAGVFNKPLDNLPSNVEYLSLPLNEYLHTISNLPNSIKFLSLGIYKLKIDKLPKKLVELVIGSPVKFEFVKAINKYSLTYIGEYNIKNNIGIEIPKGLKSIDIWNMVANCYEKCKTDEYWYKI